MDGIIPMVVRIGFFVIEVAYGVSRMTEEEIEIHKTLYHLAKEIDGCIECGIRAETSSEPDGVYVSVTVPLVSGKGVINFYAESCYVGGDVLEFCKQMIGESDEN